MLGLNLINLPIELFEQFSFKKKYPNNIHFSFCQKEALLRAFKCCFTL